MEVVTGQRRFAIALIVIEVVFIALFGLFGRYGPGMDPLMRGPDLPPLQDSYAMFTDIHIMIFIGFGFLMTFLRRYGYGAVGLNFLVAAIAVQWAIIMQGLLVNHFTQFNLSIFVLIEGDIAAAAVLITFGALLGKVGPLQLIVVALIEIVIYSINYHIGSDWFGAKDAGGSMFVHTFGAYFGLACSRAINEAWHHTHKRNANEYHSDLFSLIGTIFLWICWPSFNAALVPEFQQYRAVVNTYLALAACVVTAFAVSILTSKTGRLGVEHIQNATLAGGVAVGTCADFLINPIGAMFLGALSGSLSVVGYEYVSKWLSTKLQLHDTCGVHNLHGMPGVLAGLAGIVAAAFATTERYSLHLYDVFKLRKVESKHSVINGTGGDVETDKIGGRTAGEQALAQAAALGVTLLLAILGGFLTGLLIRWKFCQKLTETEGFDDGVFWDMPEHMPESDSDEDQPVAGGIGALPPAPVSGHNDSVKPAQISQTTTQQTTTKPHTVQFKPPHQEQQQQQQQHHHHHQQQQSS